ncbi:MAG: T6SS amidase immunity protein Tai4 family protein [Gibbsiella quercinecans]|uniref:T6SS amidase immunity protein Tai4 family protein n=1 Tax=Gibbsiella quercinecans TaxID=929813 RepID=UPI003F40F203
MKIIHFVFILAAISTPTLANAMSSETLTQETLYKNWLVSRCLGKATDSENTRQDAFRSASAYLEFSKLPMDAFDQGEELINQYLKKNTQGSVKGSYHTMECLSLLQSKEAAGIFDKYSKIQ